MQNDEQMYLLSEPLTATHFTLKLTFRFNVCTFKNFNIAMFKKTKQC